ncbi:MAG: tRNA pseudouridine(38-40) synthase TruA [Halobacteriovoraceae bacterium]|nr:tRNA pseudouridine(38-40) synthase TruA [Halobacteriovoraceae bacterium]|tara:strand:+ start:1087 stop:1875 length:789 start_codon:yes stop_codon:yes gene_type:complete
MGIQFYKIKTTYKGSHYLGWQVQSKYQGRTIQGEINKALSKVFKSLEVKTVGSGRTDAGVHAIGQVFRVEAPFFIDNVALCRALNSLLPKDIKIREVALTDSSFHPVHSAKSKEYRYFFTNEWPPSPFYFDSISYFKGPLDVGKMKKATELFLGSHDFENFFCEGTPVKHKRREIFECELVEKVEMGIGPFEGEIDKLFLFRVRGSGFLKQMVRLMVGAVLEVGKGQLSLNSLEAAINNHSKGKVGPVAPPQGLYLYKVFYN